MNPTLCPQCGKLECHCQSAWANSINETVSGSQAIDREQYERQYPTYLATSIIVGPGKFEGERIYVPYFYDQWGNGCASEDFGNIAFFVIDEGERITFPELDGLYGIALEESEQGFVYATIYHTKDKYDTALAKVEESDPEGEPERIRCDQCEALMINGVFCHETGCLNTRAKYIDGEWVRSYECFYCGSDVREGEVCDCQAPMDDNDAEVL